MGGKCTITNYNGVIFDPTYNLYTTPCYMLGRNILEIYESAEALVKAMIEAAF
jgi:enhancing lycopene biosynthesis protein 2